MAGSEVYDVWRPDTQVTQVLVEDTSCSDVRLIIKLTELSVGSVRNKESYMCYDARK